MLAERRVRRPSSLPTELDQALRVRVARALRALGRQGTVGDIEVLTGLPQGLVERGLEALLAADEGHVTVSASGVAVFHLERPVQSQAGVHHPSRAEDAVNLRGRASPQETTQASAPSGFDRKTLRLIRAREGVISVAELVEHTGLPLDEAEIEMGRLVDAYGGAGHRSLDGHMVWAFPELMTSAHGRFAIREPRPAWVRCRDPIKDTGEARRRMYRGVAGDAMGLVAFLTAPWMLLAPLFSEGFASVLAIATLSVSGVSLYGVSLFRALKRHRFFRFRDVKTLRRYALGLVFETALKGKGVVSLDRTVAYLQARAGRRTVPRQGVEAALRQLAREFDAPITELNGDLFFGFRSIKRQFLASQLVRRRLSLGLTARGRTVFNSADSPQAANERDLELFDQLLVERAFDTSMGVMET